MPGKRKSKNDKKAKGRYNKYKRGGRFRVARIGQSSAPRRGIRLRAVKGVNEGREKKD